MRNKKAKALRKEIGVVFAQLPKKEYTITDHGHKIVYTGKVDVVGKLIPSYVESKTVALGPCQRAYYQTIKRSMRDVQTSK